MNGKSCIRNFVAATSFVLASACTYVSDAEVARVTGPIGGAVTGSEISAGDQDDVAFGVLLGRVNDLEPAYILDGRDYRLMVKLALSILNHGADGKNRTWRNRHTQHHGSFTAHSTWRTAEGVECRRFTNTIYVGQSESRANGTACRQRDGTWAVMG